MKKSLLFLLLFTSLLPVPRACAGYGSLSLGNDHYQRHIFVSYGVDMTAYLLYRSLKQKPNRALWLAAGTSLFLGLAYAFIQNNGDHTYNIGNDMLANSIGIAGATGVAFVIRF